MNLTGLLLEFATNAENKDSIMGVSSVILLGGLSIVFAKIANRAMDEMNYPTKVKISENSLGQPPL